MIKKYFQVILYIVITQLSCSSQVHKSDTIDNLTIEALIKQGINTKNQMPFDSIGKKMYTVLINRNQAFRLILYDSTDTGNNTIKYFIHKRLNNSTQLRNECFDCFEICIKSVDSLMLAGCLQHRDSIEVELNRYYKLIYSGDISVKTIYDSIPYFGEVSIPQPIVHLGINIKSFEKPDGKWEVYFYCLNSIIKYYNQIRDNISLRKYGISFNEISLEKKQTIVSYRPLRIILDFDMEYCSETINPLNLVEPDF